jgi:hypothetical protein
MEHERQKGDKRLKPRRTEEDHKQRETRREVEHKQMRKLRDDIFGSTPRWTQHLKHAVQNDLINMVEIPRSDDYSQYHFGTKSIRSRATVSRPFTGTVCSFRHQ